MTRQGICFLLLILAVGSLAGCGAKPPTPTLPLPIATPTITATGEEISLLTATASPSTTPEPSETPTPTPCPPPGGWVPYAVEPGDTLYRLALPYGLTAEELREYNCLPSADEIQAGQIIYLPWYITPTPTPCYPRGDWVAYTVQSGDNLYRLALRYGLGVGDLQAGNCLESDLIVEGQILYVPYLIPTRPLPASGPPGEAAVVFPTPPSPGATPIPHAWEDDFSEPNWPTHTTTLTSTLYKQDQLWITVKVSGEWAIATPGQDLRDLTVRIDTIAPMTDRPGIAYGLVCRCQNDDNYYAFLIRRDGWYAILKMEQGEEHYLAEWEQPPPGVDVVDEDGFPNDLQIVCQGSRLELWILEQLLATAIDDAFEHGDLGLIVGSLAEPEAQVVFDDIAVDWSK